MSPNEKYDFFDSFRIVDTRALNVLCQYYSGDFKISDIDIENDIEGIRSMRGCGVVSRVQIEKLLTEIIEKHGDRK